MNQQKDAATQHENNANAKSDKKPTKAKLSWMGAFEYWVFHPGGTLPLILAAFLLTPLLESGPLNDKQYAAIYLGFVILALAVIIWGIWLIRLWGSGVELLSEEQKGQRRAENDKEMQSQIQDLRVHLRKQLPRSISKDQVAVIKEALSQFRGQKVKICSQAYDLEANQYAEGFRRLFVELGWDAKDDGPAHTYLPPGFDNAILAINPQYSSPDLIPVAILRLAKTLSSLGIIAPDGKLHWIPEVPVGEVQLWIGSKPHAA
jgi:hypothetical protein